MAVHTQPSKFDAKKICQMLLTFDKSCDIIIMGRKFDGGPGHNIHIHPGAKALHRSEALKQLGFRLGRVLRLGFHLFLAHFLVSRDFLCLSLGGDFRLFGFLGRLHLEIFGDGVTVIGVAVTGTRGDFEGQDDKLVITFAIHAREGDFVRPRDKDFFALVGEEGGDFVHIGLAEGLVKGLLGYCHIDYLSFLQLYYTFI